MPKFNIQHSVVPLLVLTFFVLSGCQGAGAYRGYSGKALPQTVTARLLVPEKFNLLYIDGNKYEAPVLAHDIRLELMPGKHRLVIEYDALWDISSEEHERVKSPAVLLDFSISSGRAYTIQTRQLKDVNEAKAYAGKPEFEIIEQVSGHAVFVVHEYRLGDKKYMAGFSTEPQEINESDKTDQASRMLEYWWRQSDAEQQQVFLDWARSHRKSRKK